MNQNLIQSIQQKISEHLEIQISHIKNCSLSGGCINNGFEFVTSAGSFFVKTNSADRYPGMFYAEAKGLQLLTTSNALKIPWVIASGEFENTSYLVLEFIHSASKKTNYWKDFAQKLAQLHKNTAPIFGLDHDNYIGSLPQSNRQTQKWTEFFVAQRLEPLVTKAVASGLLDSQTAQRFDRLFSKLDQLIPEEKPALLHGDLWSGNVMTDEHGEVCLIDPAVYYGHREIDLAFSTLFGAFSAEFYEAYNEAFPLEKGSKQRIDLFNLYPLLVHLLLFGRIYSSAIIRTLEDFQ
jgi:protein-ribulosamine 3-kinase